MKMPLRVAAILLCLIASVGFGGCGIVGLLTGIEHWNDVGRILAGFGLVSLVLGATFAFAIREFCSETPDPGPGACRVIGVGLLLALATAALWSGIEQIRFGLAMPGLEESILTLIYGTCLLGIALGFSLTALAEHRQYMNTTKSQGPSNTEAYASTQSDKPSSV